MRRPRVGKAALRPRDGGAVTGWTPMNVAICVATYKRPIMLWRLLEGISRLTFRDQQPQIRIIIVDNDVEQSARQVCDDWRLKLRWPLDYQVEPRRGIPFARNKALDSV